MWKRHLFPTPAALRTHKHQCTHTPDDYFDGFFF